MERKTVCLSHVAKYLGCLALGVKGRKKAEVMLRFLYKVEGDSSNGRAEIAEAAWWEMTRLVQSRLTGQRWQNRPDELSSQQVLNVLDEYIWDLGEKMTFHVIEEAELSGKNSSCRTKQKIAGDSPLIHSLKRKQNFVLCKFSNKHRNFEDSISNPTYLSPCFSIYQHLTNIVSSISSQEYFPFLLEYLK